MEENKEPLTRVTVDYIHPFSWLDENDWPFLSELSDEDEYDELDDIFRFIEGETDAKTYFIEQRNMMRSQAAIQQEYAERFPALMSQTLRGLADRIDSGELEFDFKFYKNE